jgi:integrase
LEYFFGKYYTTAITSRAPSFSSQQMFQHPSDRNRCRWLLFYRSHPGLPRSPHASLQGNTRLPLVLGGVDLVTGKELLGHADITMTMRYVHPSPETKRKAVEAYLIRKRVAH